MPLPPQCCRPVQVIVKMEPVPGFVIARSEATWRPEREARGSALGVQSREGTCSPYRSPLKWHAPIASVAALIERLWQLHISEHHRRPHTPCRGRRPRRPVGDCRPVPADDKIVMAPKLSLRGGRRPTWQSRSTRLDHRGTFGENVTACTRLHPKGTSSRCALRAPRPLWGLAMTNLWRSPSYRQPALAVSTAPGPAVPSPAMAGACIGSGTKFAGCTRCVGDAAPYNTLSILQQHPQKMQSLFSETAFFHRPNRRKCALPARFFCSGDGGGAGRKAQTPPCGADLMSHCQTIYGRSAQNLTRFLEHLYEIDFVVIQSVDIPVSSGV